MRLDEVLDRASDMVTVRRAYGDPIDRGDVTVIPVAAVSGGGGGGSGQGPDGEGGTGGGFGLSSRPLGVLVLRGDRVRFQPLVHPEGLLKAAAIFLVALGFFVRRLRR